MMNAIPLQNPEPDESAVWRPHVTVQNKVTPELARALQKELQATFAPFEVEGVGLSLWRYLGGPWEQLAVYSFRGS